MSFGFRPRCFVWAVFCCLLLSGQAFGQSSLARPEDITLKGNLRVEDMSSAVGRIALRWPRSVETLFGRTPVRAMADAASSVSRALKQSSFPSPIQSLNLDWNVVFMGSEMRVGEIPQYLMANCHPGWMTPPANIYIVGDRVAKGCSASAHPVKVADAELAQVLVHEMGHAVEFALLGGVNFRDRMVSEGFATWFQEFASDYSSVIPHGILERQHRELAKVSLRVSGQGWTFQGTAEDYSRASMYFKAIVSRRGVSGLVAVYGLMKTGAPFAMAVDKALGWNAARFEGEVGKVIGAD